MFAAIPSGLFPSLSGLQSRRLHVAGAKPRAPEERKEAKNFAGSDVRGRTKYAPLNEFGSVQTLPRLAALFP